MKTVIEMAREARVYSDCTEWTIGKSKTFVATHESIQRLVELVRADERARTAEQPAQQKPLTGEEIREIWVEHGCEGEDAEGFARAIEAAHGIKENA